MKGDHGWGKLCENEMMKCGNMKLQLNYDIMTCKLKLQTVANKAIVLGSCFMLMYYAGKMLLMYYAGVIKLHDTGTQLQSESE